MCGSRNDLMGRRLRRAALAALLSLALLPSAAHARPAAPRAHASLSRLAGMVEASRGSRTFPALSLPMAGRLAELGLFPSARALLSTSPADPRLVALEAERMRDLLERVERSPLTLPEGERDAYVPVRAHARDLDGDGADDLAVLLAEPLGPPRGRHRGAWLVVIKSCEPGHPPLARKILSGAVFTAASMETLEMNRLGGFELVVKLAREDGLVRLAVAGRSPESDAVEVRACFDSAPAHDAADLDDPNGDGYVELIRYEKIQLRRGVLRFPAVYAFRDGELIPAESGFRDLYLEVSEEIGRRFELDAAGMDPDPEALGWRITALRLAGEFDEAIARSRDLLRALGRPDARNADRRVAILEGIGEMERKKEELSRAARVTVF